MDDIQSPTVAWRGLWDIMEDLPAWPHSICYLHISLSIWARMSQVSPVGWWSNRAMIIIRWWLVREYESTLDTLGIGHTPWTDRETSETHHHVGIRTGILSFTKTSRETNLGFRLYGESSNVVLDIWWYFNIQIYCMISWIELREHLRLESQFTPKKRELAWTCSLTPSGSSSGDIDKLEYERSFGLLALVYFANLYVWLYQSESETLWPGCISKHVKTWGRDWKLVLNQRCYSAVFAKRGLLGFESIVTAVYFRGDLTHAHWWKLCRSNSGNSVGMQQTLASLCSAEQKKHAIFFWSQGWHMSQEQNLDWFAIKNRTYFKCWLGFVWKWCTSIKWPFQMGNT